MFFSLSLALPPAYGNNNRVKFLDDTKFITAPNNPQVPVTFDQGCDQGYGSERSPEDELPPPLPIVGYNQQQQQFNQMLMNPMMMMMTHQQAGQQQSLMSQGQAMMDINSLPRPHPQDILQGYDFITEGEHACTHETAYLNFVNFVSTLAGRYTRNAQPKLSTART